MKAVFYSKDNCQWCERVRALFENLDIEYLEYKHEKDFTKDQFYDEFGEGSTFPQVLCDEKKLGGAVDTIKFLREHQLVKS